MSAVRSKSAIVVEEKTQSRPARGGQVLACEEDEYVLLLECNIFQVSGIRYLPSIRSKSDLFTASMVPLLALIPYHFSSGEKKDSGRNLISQVAVYLSEEGLHPVVEVVRFFPSSQGCHANLVPGMFKI